MQAHFKPRKVGKAKQATQETGYTTEVGNSVDALKLQLESPESRCIPCLLNMLDKLLTPSDLLPSEICDDILMTVWKAFLSLSDPPPVTVVACGGVVSSLSNNACQPMHGAFEAPVTICL